MEASAAWDDLVAPFLADDLWRPRDAYDAGHYLQVPVHAAFALGRRDWQRAVASHFRRYVDSGAPRIENPLLRFQYLYVASRFVVLADSHGDDALIPPGLPQILYREIRRAWERDPARHWGRDPDHQALPLRELLAWKLGAQDVEPRFLRALRDEELFALMIAADLLRYRRSAGPIEPGDEELLDEILRTADRVFTQEVEWTADGKGWLLQPGVWADHRDYRYAGHSEIAPDLEPAPVPGLSMDSAHRHRLPLWLVSLAGAHGPGTTGRREALRLQRGLERRFLEVVLVPPSEEFPGYRLNNFMDGSNGVYRYGYQTLAPDLGYGPFERSGKLRLGWWRFLPGDRVERLYRDLCRQHPLPEPVARLYRGPGTNRPRHPILVRADGELQELLVYLAAQLPPDFVEDLNGR